MKIKLFILNLFLLLTYSCSNSASKDTSAAPVITENITTEKLNPQKKTVISVSDSVNYLLSDTKARYYFLKDSLKNSGSKDYDLLWNFCDEYVKLNKLADSLNLPKIDSIKKSLLSVVDAPEANQQLIEKILSSESAFTLNQHLYAIFNLEDTLKIYDEYNLENERLKKSFASNTKLIDENDVPIGPSITSYQSNYLDSILNKDVFIFNKDTIIKSKISSFKKYTDKCFEYDYFEFEQALKNSTNTPLIASDINIEIEFLNNSQLDKKLNNLNFFICGDCLDNFNDKRIFAKLIGYDNLYFVYAATENSELDDIYTPIRALYYISNDIAFELWFESIDLFGCSCL